MEKQITEYEKGFLEGSKSKAISIAIKLLTKSKTADADLVCGVTGLSKEAIELIQNTLLLGQHNVDEIVADNTKNVPHK